MLTPSGQFPPPLHFAEKRKVTFQLGSEFADKAKFLVQTNCKLLLQLAKGKERPDDSITCVNERGNKKIIELASTDEKKD